MLRVQELQNRTISPPVTGSGSEDNPLVLDDEDDEIVKVRIERGSTRLPSPYPRTLIPVLDGPEG